MVLYQTKILGRMVKIRPNGAGQLEISMQGRGGFEIHPGTFLNLRQAKAVAHAFVHSTLQRRCGCEGIRWKTVIEALP